MVPGRCFLNAAEIGEQDELTQSLRSNTMHEHLIVLELGCERGDAGSTDECSLVLHVVRKNTYSKTN